MTLPFASHRPQIWICFGAAPFLLAVAPFLLAVSLDVLGYLPLAPSMCLILVLWFSLPSILSHHRVAFPTWTSTYITSLGDRALEAKVQCHGCRILEGTLWAATVENEVRMGLYTRDLDLSVPVDFHPGVACITLAFVDERGVPISLAPWAASPPGSPDPLQEEDFEQLTQVTRCPLGPDSSSGKSGSQ